MVDLNDIMVQAQAMQQQFVAMQERLAEQEVTGRAGGGLVVVTLNGKGDVKRVSLDASLLVPAEKTILEDLIVAAMNDARGNVETGFMDALQTVSGSATLPPDVQEKI
jgi:DNA-binding YbaB/EbfC family protein